jgi:hypothetical protein
MKLELFAMQIVVFDGVTNVEGRDKSKLSLKVP